MTNDEILVTILSLFGIAFTFWYFLMKKEIIVEIKNDEADITVEGGYTPNVISIPQGKTTKVSFTRRDPSSCLEEVVLPDFRVRKYLPLNQKITVNVTPEHTGEFVYSCGMNMFHGKIIVTK